MGKVTGVHDNYLGKEFKRVLQAIDAPNGIDPVEWVEGFNSRYLDEKDFKKVFAGKKVIPAEMLFNLFRLLKDTESTEAVSLLDDLCKQPLHRITINYERYKANTLYAYMQTYQSRQAMRHLRVYLGGVQSYDDVVFFKDLEVLGTALICLNPEQRKKAAKISSLILGEYQSCDGSKSKLELLSQRMDKKLDDILEWMQTPRDIT